MGFFAHQSHTSCPWTRQPALLQGSTPKSYGGNDGHKVGRQKVRFSFDASVMPLFYARAVSAAAVTEGADLFSAVSTSTPTATS